METTVTATEDGKVEKIQLEGGILVNSEDLVLILG